MQTFFIYILGLIFGLTFPDFDYFFERFIGHRSIFSHSILIVVIFITLLKNLKDLKKTYYISGLLNGIIMHLISDLNLPSNFTNIQTIKIFMFDLGDFSFYWILINILIGFYLLRKFTGGTYSMRIELLNLIIFIIFVYLSSDIYHYLTVIYIFLKTISFSLNRIKIIF